MRQIEKALERALGEAERQLAVSLHPANIIKFSDGSAQSRAELLQDIHETNWLMFDKGIGDDCRMMTVPQLIEFYDTKKKAS